MKVFSIDFSFLSKTFSNQNALMSIRFTQPAHLIFPVRFSIRAQMEMKSARYSQEQKRIPYPSIQEARETWAMRGIP